MRAIAFVDHEIGYRLLQEMLAPGLRGKISLLAVVTSRENGTDWWPGVEALVRESALPLLRYPDDGHRLLEFGPVDFFFLLSWKYLMPPDVLSVPKIGVLNLHYSLLPKYRGVYPVNWAIIKGETETGVTFHWVNSGIDSGPIACQKNLPILPEDTARTLQLRMDDLACVLFDELICSLKNHGHHLLNNPTSNHPSAYFSREIFELANEIDFKKDYPTKDLINLLRGKTFLPHGKHAYFRDPTTRRKIYLSLVLKAEE